MEDKEVEEEIKSQIDHFIATDLYDHKDRMHEKVSYNVKFGRFPPPLMFYYIEKIFSSGLNIDKFTYNCSMPTIHVHGAKADMIPQLLKLAELVQVSTTVTILGDISLDVLFEPDDLSQFCERLYGNTTLRLLIIDLGACLLTDDHLEILKDLVQNTHITRVLFTCLRDSRNGIFSHSDTFSHPDTRKKEAEIDVFCRVPFEERGVQVFSKTKSAAKAAKLS